MTTDITQCFYVIHEHYTYGDSIKISELDLRRNFGSRPNLYKFLKFEGKRS